MSGKAKPAQAREFTRGGKAGRGPGRGPWNLAGTTSTFRSSRPGAGLNPKGPPKGKKP